jgi:hypothetical protein
MNTAQRQEWINSLKIGDKVTFCRKGEDKRELLIRVIDDSHICMVDTNKPKSDLALGEVVWKEFGEGPFNERIEPL